MTIIDKPLLRSMAMPGRCEWCGRHCKAREAHHLFCRGIGGGGRLDIRCNLVALGSSITMACTCHHDHHSIGDPSTDALLAVACQREGLLQGPVRELIDFLRRVPKELLRWQVAKAMDGMSGSGKALAKRFLREHRSKAS